MTRCKEEEIVEVKINDLELRKSKDFMENIKEHHLEMLRKYDIKNKIKPCNDNTRTNQLLLLMQFIRDINKSFGDITKDDIDQWIMKYKDFTLERYKLEIKKFFRWYGKPQIVDHLKGRKLVSKWTRMDMWDEDEILKLLQCVDPDKKERDQAAVMINYDMALENKAVREINIGDIYDSGDIMRIKIHGKKRGKVTTTVLEAIHSAYYIRLWLNKHPHRDNPKAPLFVSLHPNSFGKRIHNNFMRSLLHKLQKRSGINKKSSISPVRIKKNKLISN